MAARQLNRRNDRRMRKLYPNVRQRPVSLGQRLADFLRPTLTMRTKAIAFFAVLALVLWSGAPTRAAANDPTGSARSVAATPVPAGATAIQIDGAPTEDVWAKAPAITDFLQRRPAEGNAPAYQTEARVLFDATNLYVAVTAADPEPGKLVGLRTRRDDLTASDWLSVYVDSFHDKRTAYEFGVNPAGVKYDRYWFNDGNNDISWDAVWDVAVTKTATGWRAEFRIPFSQLRFNPSTTKTFGFALGRIIQRRDEASTWPLIRRSASGFVSQFAELTGLSFSQPLRKFELTPYALGQATVKPVEKGNPLSKSPDPTGTFGLDMKYAVAPGLTLTASANPDFGQVEADPAVVNLSGFETFFPEKRPFFVEGSGNFSFDIDCEDGDCTGLFYSRRIGRTPHRFVSAPSGGYATAPTNTTILGAAKLTGRVGKFSIGALNAVTSSENATISVNGVRSSSPVEPASSYSVARAVREFSNRSRIGFMATSTNRRLSDELKFLPANAFTGGTDFDWRFKGKYSLNGYVAGSTVRGSADAIAGIQRSTVHSYQRPDAESFDYDPTRTGLSGHAGSVGIGKISGKYTMFNSSFGYKSPGFDINDLGFQSRADEISQSNWFQIRSDTPNKWRRSLNINFNQWSGYNFDGDRRYSGANINSHTTLTSNWSMGMGINVNGRGFADRLTRGGPGGYTNPNQSVWAYLNSDSRKPFTFYVNINAFTDHKNSSNAGISPGLTWRPRSGVAISTSFNLSKSQSDSQWITNLADQGATRYVFGHLEQKTVGITARVNYTISPTLTLQIYAQPFVAAGDYSNFKELKNGRADRYEDRYAPYAYASNPDFNFRSFRTTNVLRWEYRPGSALFVVWQQGREDFANDGALRYGGSLSDLFGKPSTNVFLVKFSRWLNF
ncbi:MAG: hypothetical protein EPO35_10510 [Acidobacteria bacterium]|nr:MAG: hypothetical protein EPO35_10510 [Acidobacteriota bacterium]